jgi:hypothetical protein
MGAINWSRPLSKGFCYFLALGLAEISRPNHFLSYGHKLVRREADYREPIPSGAS